MDFLHSLMVFNVALMVVVAFGAPLSVLWLDIRHGQRIDLEYVSGMLFMSAGAMLFPLLVISFTFSFWNF